MIGAPDAPVEARKVAQTRDGGAAEPAAAGEPGQVTSLTLRRIAALPPDTRPLPTVDAYDQLLRQRRTAGRNSRDPCPGDDRADT